MNAFTAPLGTAFTHYLAAGQGGVVAAPTLAGLLKKLPHLAVPPAPQALSHHLHHSLVPYPHTIYPHVWAVGVGDTARFTEQGAPPRITNGMPFLPENRLPQERPASPAILKALLVESLHEKLPAGKPAALMLSSGKDSVAIALALKESGLAGHVHALTYAEDGSPASEAEVAASIAAKTGMKHTVIPLPTNPAEVRAAMAAFFTESAQPVADPVCPAYILALHRAGVKNRHLIDGTGNDLYMGILPPKNQKWYRHGPGAWNAADILQELIPFHNPLNKFLRPPSDGPILGRLALRRQETRRLFASTPTNPFWRAQGANPRLRGPYQRFFQHMRGYYYDGCHTSRVREEAAHAGHNTLVTPYVSAGLYDYFRQLPPPARYDEAAGRNKLLLRQMLMEDIGYDADKIGKRIFSFNQAAFLQTHREFVEEEILACTLWHKTAAETLTRKLYTQLSSTPAVRYGLMQLFLLAGWHNHSRYLKPGQ